MGYLLAVLSAQFFASSNLFFKKALRPEGPLKDKFVGVFVSVLINNLINILILGISFIFQPLPRLNMAGTVYFALGGLLNAFVGRYLLLACIEHIGSSRASSLKISSPIFTLFAGVLFLRERLAFRSLIGIGMIVLGVLYLSREPYSANSSEKGPAEEAESGERGSSLKGIALGILSGSFVGLGNVFRKMGITLYPSPIVAVFVGSFASLVCAFFVLVGRHKIAGLRANLGKALNIGYIMGGVCTSLAQYSLFFSLRLLPVSLANSILSIEPLLVIFLVYIFFKREEIINRRVIISACTIILGAVFIVTS